MTSVVLAHDYLTQQGGAERVALSLTRAFPGSAVVTSFYSPEQTYAAFTDVEVLPSKYNRVAPLRKDPRLALPLLPYIWDNLEVPDADVVLCSSSGWSHGLRTSARKVVYCHNPPRWLYQPADYAKGLHPVGRTGLWALGRMLRHWDSRAASSADVYLANSASVAQRIHDAYGIQASVVHPPVMVDLDGERDPVPACPPSYFLTVARSRGYKNVDLVCKAFASMPDQNLVVLGGAGNSAWPENISFLPRVTEAELRSLYAGATALVATAHEDFGLTVVEAAAFGTPTVALAAGGYLETVMPGISGRLIEQPTIDAVTAAVRAELDKPTDRSSTALHARRFSEEEFHERLRAVVRAT